MSETQQTGVSPAVASDASDASRSVRCYTRALKNARFLQEHAPDIFRRDPAAGGFGTGLSLELLRGLHRVSPESPVLNRQPHVAEFLRTHPLPRPGTAARDPLFTGTVHFAQLTFQTSTATFVMDTADMNQIVAYTQHAVVPISEYASQYGSNSLAVSPTLLTMTVSVPGGTYTDAQLQQWVNQLATNNGLSSGSCIFVISPQGVSAANVGGNAGYHGQANIPYVVAGVYASGLTLADQPDVYAMVVSHELAEMVVDPTVDHVNPEVCDPCDINCNNLTRCYFGASNNFLGTNQDSPPAGFSFAYYTCAVVKPAGATACPAPTNTCQYAPPASAGGWAELYSNTDSLVMLDVASNADGRLEVFGVNAQGHIWHTWQTAPNNGWAGGWSELYSNTDSLTSLKVARNADGRLEVFGVNAQGNIWHTWQTAPNNGWAGGWAELYSNTDSLVMLDVASNADGRLEVFGVNAQGHIWHTWQTAPNNGWAGGWSELYSNTDSLTSLKVARNADGRLEVFGVNAQGNIWHTWQTAPNNGWAGGWAELYSNTDSLVMLDVASNADGRLEVFGVNAQGHIWHTWQTAPNNGWAGGWAELYSNTDSLTSLKVARNADGRLEVFGVNAQGNIWHTWQTAPNNGWAGGWAELYSNTDSLVMLDVASNADGRLEVFGVNAQGHIWHTWQTAPNNGWVGG